MNEKVLQIVIKAKDEAEKTLKGVTGNLDNIRTSANKTAKVLGGALVVAGGAAVAFGIASINAYKEAERATRQLENAIIGVSKGTKEQVEQVQTLTKALQKKSGIDGDALNIGVAQLSTFGLQSKSVIDLTKSLADLTVNQDGVNAGADSYISSANIMAKALRGEFGMLEKMGIRFTETQKNMIKFGDESKKVAAIQEGLAQNLRETTDTVANGLDGALARVKTAYGEIFETFGANVATLGVAPVLNLVADALNRIAESDIASIFNGAKDSLGNFFNMINENTALVDQFKSIWESISYAFNEWLKPSLDQLRDTIAENKVILGDLLGYFVQFIGLIGGAALMTALLLVKVTVELLTKAIELLSWGVESLGSAFKGVTGFIDGAYKALKKFLDKAQELGGGAVDKIKGFFGKGKATGGGVQVGQSYMVGEKGPEMFTPSSNGSITPNYKMAGAGGMNLTINMNGGTYLDDNVAERIGDRIVQVFKRTARF